MEVMTCQGVFLFFFFSGRDSNQDPSALRHEGREGKQSCFSIRQGLFLRCSTARLHKAFWPRSSLFPWRVQSTWGGKAALEGSLRITGVIKRNFFPCCFCLFYHRGSEELAKSLTQQVLPGNARGAKFLLNGSII